MNSKLLKKDYGLGTLIFISIFVFLMMFATLINLKNLFLGKSIIPIFIFISICLFFVVFLTYKSFIGLQIFEFYSDKIIIRKPFCKRKNVQKGVNYWEVYHDEWDELVHFSVKNGSILYFRKEKTLVFIIKYSPIDDLGKKIFKLYPRKKIYLNSDFKYSNDLISELKEKFPERYSE
jgi:hypothetical protein